MPHTWGFYNSLAAFFPAFPEEDNSLEKFESLRWRTRSLNSQGVSKRKHPACPHPLCPCSLPTSQTPKPPQGEDRQLEGKKQFHSKTTSLHPASQVPQLGFPQPLGSGARLARDQRKSSFPRGRTDGIDEQGDRGSAGDRAALESREGGQEAWGWSPLRALLSSLHPEPREGAGSCTGPAAGL